MDEIFNANYKIDWRPESWKLKAAPSKSINVNSFMDVRTVARDVSHSRTGEKVVSGYAAFFNVPSVEIDLVYQMCKPGCFKDALESGREIRLLINHEPDKLLASTRDGSLKLEEVQAGLYFEWMVPGYRSEIQKDGLQMIGAGCGASIGWDPSKSFLDEQTEYVWNERKRWTLYRCPNLLEISLTMTPRFSQTLRTIVING